MITPKKPAKPPPRPKTVTSDEPLLQLTAGERELLAAYRATDDAHQFELLRITKRTAERVPRRVRPSLRLVVGGGA